MPLTAPTTTFRPVLLARNLLQSWILIVGIAFANAADAPKAARSVHLGYAAPEATAFSLEMVVEQSVAGSYFMACGWNTGYFGIQELDRSRKVALFSVWDPTTGDDPNSVKTEDRVEILHQDAGVRIKRFGGEGTGGQCMVDFDWAIGATNRFAVTATPSGKKTAYAGYLWSPATQSWRHLVTFQTRTGGQYLKGLYSFVEDFRRDTRSALETRRARFGNIWVKPSTNDWTSIRSARFTASGAEWEAKETINAGVQLGTFFLATGGPTTMEVALKSKLELGTPRPPFPDDLQKLIIPR